MIIIYDFDGTLTPYSLPQYEILKKCGYTDAILMNRINALIKKDKFYGMYDAFYKCYKDIFSENEITMSKENVCLGAKHVVFNNGVIEYFKKFQSKKTGIKHYIVTSGIKDYIEETKICEFVDGIYGTTFNQKNEIFEDINILLTDEKKVDAIKKLQKENKETNQVIYFGDGLTDKFAFEYVHSIGGKNVFVGTNNKSRDNYERININGIINKYFDADFGNNSNINNYINNQLIAYKGNKEESHR